MVIFSLRDVHGGLQFGFKDGGQVIVPVVLEFTVVNSSELYIYLTARVRGLKMTPKNAFNFRHFVLHFLIT